MKILYLALGGEWVASSRTRVYQFIPHLQKEGFQVTVFQYRTNLDSKISAGFGKRSGWGRSLVKFLRRLSNYFNLVFAIQAIRFLLLARRNDIVVIQKVLLPSFAIRWLPRVNPNILFDMDDAIHLLALDSERKLWDKFLPTIKLALVENELNAGHFSKYNIPSLKIIGPIDCERYRPRQKSTRAHPRIVLGWIGSETTVQHLEIIREPLMKILHENPEVEFWIIGSETFKVPPGSTQVKYFKWSLDSEVTLLQEFDIGLMPLTNDDWCRGKGGYKILQYMALGIPSIASPVGVNSQIVKNQNTGFLADLNSEWYEALRDLIKNDSLRNRLGVAARAEAETVYSFEASTPKVIEAFLRFAPATMPSHIRN